ncbi:MAG: hypothetical protein L6R36_008656 [Xanthoria steineri]|nr:MAG: hypothetical protein L6R36_008656 [Xanthoria steineri]
MACASATMFTFFSMISRVSSASAEVRSFWDVCKPSYAAAGPTVTCDNDDSPHRLDHDGRASCEGAYFYSGDPVVINAIGEQSTRGFAQLTLANEGYDTIARCCICYKLTLTAGPAKGSVLVVQVVDVHRQDQIKDPTFTLAIPGLTGYDNDCSCQYGKESDDNRADYDKTECPETLQEWSYCGRNWAHIPINGPNDGTNPVYFGKEHKHPVYFRKEHKIAIGVCIPLFFAISALVIYCLKRRPTPPQKDPQPRFVKKTWIEQIRWEKPELDPTCLQEIGNKSIRELRESFIHEKGSIQTKSSTAWREALKKIWNIRSITPRSQESPRAPKGSVRDI